MSKAIQEVSNNVIKLNTVLDKMIQDNSKKDFTKCKNTIELSFICFENNVFKRCANEYRGTTAVAVYYEYGINILLNNNIETNRDLIISNISQKVNTEYYKIYSALSIFEIKEIVVSTHLHSEWIDDITKDLINIIYNGQDKEARVNQISSKLKLTMNAYSTQVSNKTFN